jgi:hypothetical protein
MLLTFRLAISLCLSAHLPKEEEEEEEKEEEKEEEEEEEYGHTHQAP